MIFWLNWTQITIELVTITVLWLIDLVFFQVKIHAEEMSESETAFMLEQGRLGIEKTGQQLGLLAGK